MEQKNERNSKKRLNSLILLVAFTAILLIVSTYAWFSTQKNVTLGGIQGKVNVAEGLQISLDAKTWKNEIDFSSFTENADGDLVSEVYLPGATLQAPYDGGTNVIPEELLPVSTTGTESIDSDDQLYMYWGDNTDAIKLASIRKMNEEPASGYFAIDVFLQNSSAEGVTADVLQLEPNSTLSLLGGTAKETTGLQNTVRVALALYENDGNIPVDGETTTEEIIAGTQSQNIYDVAIWEPNANAHVQQIVDTQAGYMKWSDADATAIFGEGATATTKFGLASQLPTYAVTANSIDVETLQTTPTTVKGIKNIYDWSTEGIAISKLAKQYTLQTTTDGIVNATPFVSATDGSTQVTIPGSEYIKARLYIWLEGQDVDCINYASLGGGIDLDFGFSKPGSNS